MADETRGLSSGESDRGAFGAPDAAAALPVSSQDTALTDLASAEFKKQLYTDSRGRTFSINPAWIANYMAKYIQTEQQAIDAFIEEIYNPAGVYAPVGEQGIEPISAPETPIGEIPAGGILSVQRTTDPDQFIVRVQIGGADPGIYTQTLMSRDDITAQGGEIPAEGTAIVGFGAGEKWAGTEGITEQDQARQQKAQDEALQDLGLPIGEALLDTLTAFRANPNDPQFRLDIAGGTITSEQKSALAQLAKSGYRDEVDWQAAYLAGGIGLTRAQKSAADQMLKFEYDAQKEWQDAVIQVGRDIPQGKPEYISKIELARIKESDPTGADVLLRSGTEAYGTYLSQVQKGRAEALTPYKVGAEGYDLAGAVAEGKIDKSELVAIFGKDAVDKAVGQATDEKRNAQLKKEYDDWINDNIRSDSYLSSILASDGELAAVAAWEKRQSDVIAISERQQARQIQAEKTLSDAGFTSELPTTSTPVMRTVGAPNIKLFTVPAMAEFVRNNPDTGMQTLRDYGFTDNTLSEINKYNDELDAAVSRAESYLSGKDARYGGKGLALSLALDTLGVDISPVGAAKVEKGMMGGLWRSNATGEILTDKELVAAQWVALTPEQKYTVASAWDKDYFKGSYFAEISKGMSDVSAEAGIMGMLAYGPILPVTTPIAKQLTLKEAKAQLSKTFATELSTLSNYVKADGTFDLGKLDEALITNPNLKEDLLEKTGYENIDDLKKSAEYYNYGTTVSAKEWAMGALVAALDIMALGVPIGSVGSATIGRIAGIKVLPSIVRGVATTGGQVINKVVSAGIPAGLGALMLPDTIKMVSMPEVGFGEKAMAVGTTAALLAGVAIGAGKFVFKEVRQVVKPASFEPSNFSLEVSIPRSQLKGNMTPTVAKTLVQDLERVYGGKLPKEIETAVSKFKTPEDAMAWAEQFISFNKLTGQVKGIKSVEGAGGIKSRSNPAQISLDQQILFSVKPDSGTYISGIGKAGKDVTPAGSMEWWSTNWSGDVAGWYLGKIPDTVVSTFTKANRAVVSSFAKANKLDSGTAAVNMIRKYLTECL